MRSVLTASAVFLLAAVPFFGQSAVASYPADLAVPFGVAKGRLFTVENHLLFIDLERIDSSFAIPRNIMRATVDASGVLHVHTDTPVQDRTGVRDELAFRLNNADTGQRLLEWAKMGGTSGPAQPLNPQSASQSTRAPGAAPTTAAPTGASADSSGQTVFNVRHNHLVGGCEGRLVLEDARLVYESINDADHSRLWALSDIKELQRGSPYKLEVKPFSGNNYDFELLGQGMDNQTYQSLVDRVTKARLR